MQIVTFAPQRLHALVLSWFCASMLVETCMSMTPICCAAFMSRPCDTAPPCQRFPPRPDFRSPTLRYFTIHALSQNCNNVLSPLAISHSYQSFLIAVLILCSRVITILGSQDLGLSSSRTPLAQLWRSLLSSTFKFFLHMYNYPIVNSNAPASRTEVN